jgi:hypothetical protein
VPALPSCLSDSLKEAAPVECTWKQNWEETRRRLVDWWNGEGLVIGGWESAVRGAPRENAPDPGPPADACQRFADPEWLAGSNHCRLAGSRFPADLLPIANCDMGPGSLALYLGSEPTFHHNTVWYNPTMEHEEHPEDCPPLSFDPESRWWQITAETVSRSAGLGKGRYMVGCPDLIENIDILASLRGTQNLLMDMVVRPEWVEQKVEEINRAWFEAYDRIYETVKLEDGSSAFRAFAIWGPGKTAKVQCDASAMFSPAMFERFVLPALSRQCEWLDHSMFHLDGHQCIPHLDLLLSIDALGAIEWTPDPQVPPGGNARWYDMYRRILEAGKSVQAIGVEREEILPLLDAVGGKGLYIMTAIPSEREAEDVMRAVEPYH